MVKAAFTQGRLTKAKFDERVALVFAARTYADLDASLSTSQPWCIRSGRGRMARS